MITEYEEFKIDDTINVTSFGTIYSVRIESFDEWIDNWRGTGQGAWIPIKSIDNKDVYVKYTLNSQQLWTNIHAIKKYNKDVIRNSVIDKII